MTTLGDSTPSNRAAKLLKAATDAADVRKALGDPNVRALRIERRRWIVSVLIWASVALGLLFTMSNVQAFAARGTSLHSLAWWFAWALDPTLTLTLVGVLVAEQTMATWRVAPPKEATQVKLGTLGLTYAMNTWTAWSQLDARLVLQHSAPVIAVFLIVKAAPKIYDAITTTVEVAAGPDSPVSVTGQADRVPAPVTVPDLPDTLQAPAPTGAPVSVTAEVDWTGLDEKTRQIARAIGAECDRSGKNISRSVIKAGFADRDETISTDRAALAVKYLKIERGLVDAPALHVVGGDA